MVDFKTLNSGEWSEFYVFLKLLYSGKLQGCDEHLQLLQDFIKIVSIKNFSKTGELLEYQLDNEKIILRMAEQDIVILPFEKIKKYSQIVFDKIKSNRERTFCIEELNRFINKIGDPLLKSASRSKRDITLRVVVPVSNTPEDFGFSIKSNLAENSTLLNASAGTNITYEVDLLPQFKNKYQYKTKTLLSKLTMVDINLDSFDSNVFYQNLQLIDTQLPIMVSSMVLAYYQKKGTTIIDLIDFLKKYNPLNLTDTDIYYTKIGEFLLSVLLGMTPKMKWDKSFDADGGLIVVKDNGDLATFYIFKSDYIKKLMKYLILHSYLDTPSTTRHHFGFLYESENKVKLKLNLQIRLDSIER